MEQPGIRLLTLGRVELLGAGREGESLNRRRRKLALLALLALERRPVPRERVVEMFWGGQPDGRARHSLSDAISHLRRVIGSTAIIAHRQGLSLNPALDISLDVLELERAAAAGDWARVAALDAGPFLAGVTIEASTSFDDWVSREAARVRAIAAGAYRTGCESLAATGAWQDALALSARWVDAAPDSAKARRFAARARTVLAEHGSAGPHPPVGDELCAPWQVAVAGAPQLVLLTGEAAARRTASSALRRMAVAHQATVVAIQADVAGSAEPMSVVREIAAALLDAPGAAGADPVHLCALRGMSGEAGDRRPVPDRLREGTLTDAIRGVLESVAYEAPVLVAIDDAHLADAASLELLHAALRQATGPVMALLSAPDGTERGSGAIARMADRATLVQLTASPVPRAGDMPAARRRRWTAGPMLAAAAAAMFLLFVANAARARHYAAAPPARALDGRSSASLTARRLYDAGVRAYYAGQSGQARPLFEAALREDPAFAMAAHYAALAHGAHDDDARRRALRLADRAPDRERLLIRAWWLGELDDPAGAAAAETLAVRYPDETSGLLAYGRALESRGDFTAAIAWFRRAVVRDSAALRGGAITCDACGALGRIRTAALFAGAFAVAEDAARRLAAASRDDHTRATGWLEVALVRARDLRFDAAAAAVDSALRLDPAVDPWYVRHQIAVRSGRLAEAERMVRASLDQAPPTLRFDRLGDLVTTLRLQGRHAEAIATARRARALGDSLRVGFADAGRLLAVAQLATEPQAAAALFDSIATVPFVGAEFPARNARQRAWMLTHVATALANAGDTTRLARLADTVQALSGRSAYGRDRRLHLYIRGLLVAARGDSAGAAALLRRARYSPTENHLAVRLARAELASGAPRAAIGTAESALRGPLDSQNQYELRSELLEVLGDAYAAVGDRRRAVRYYRATAAAWARADHPWRDRGARAARLADRLAAD